MTPPVHLAGTRLPESKAAVARALVDLERDPDGSGSLRLLEAAWRAPRGRVVGVTGPPGVGKSTLTGALLTEARRRGLTVAVIAVDPSSRISGGALLGDRLRLAGDPDDDGSFIRSMAARDRLGGLAAESFAAAILLRAVYDLVLVETVGVGQSETDVAELADSVVFCVQPASGDSLQFMKAGIVEVPHIAVVTKADLGAAARRALADLKGALSLARSDRGWAVECLALAARAPGAAAELLDALDRHWDHLISQGHLEPRRAEQATYWLTQEILRDFGRFGLAATPALSVNQDPSSPFTRRAEIRKRLKVVPDVERA